MDFDSLVASLQQPESYPYAFDGPVTVHQTHISVVCLAGQFAYKIKKPIQADFVDYSTLERRKHFCEEEIRLDGRYANGLYIAVVPISIENGRLSVEGGGRAIEYAVKMHRFSNDALLSERARQGQLTFTEIQQLALSIAEFHRDAHVSKVGIAGRWPEFLINNIQQIIGTLKVEADPETRATLDVLQAWAFTFFDKHLIALVDRVDAGFIRECHGDLHLANVVDWKGKLVPFDGIEFNEHLRWIDVLSDALFLAMDLTSRGHPALSRSFANAYLEHTGDYGSTVLLPLFHFYRALVRALAASMRSDAQDLQAHVALAYRYTLRDSPVLWITHGLSGSGKTSLSEAVVQQQGAIRIRSDVERKRLFGLSPTQRPTKTLAAKMYNKAGSRKTYQRLETLSRSILDAGHSVIVDATFLKQKQRSIFLSLAEQAGVPLKILDCQCDLPTLKQRILARNRHGQDASDADLNVLESQLATQDPLTEEELQHVVLSHGAVHVTKPA